MISIETKNIYTQFHLGSNCELGKEMLSIKGDKEMKNFQDWCLVGFMAKVAAPFFPATVCRFIFDFFAKMCRPFLWHHSNRSTTANHLSVWLSHHSHMFTKSLHSTTLTSHNQFLIYSTYLKSFKFWLR